MQSNQQPGIQQPLPRAEGTAPLPAPGPIPQRLASRAPAVGAGGLGRRGAGILILAGVLAAIGVGAVATGALNVPGLHPSPQLTAPQQMSSSEVTEADSNAEVTKYTGVYWHYLTPQSIKERNLTTTQTEGFVITALAAPSPAEKSGLRVNDIVLALDGVPVGTNAETWYTKVRMTPIGGVLQVTIERAGAIQQIPLTVGKCNATPAQRAEYLQSTGDRMCPVWARQP